VTDQSITTINPSPATTRVLQKIAAAPAKVGVQETTDPEECLFVELIMSGESITGAFLRATGKGVDLDSATLRSWSGAAQEYRSRPEVNALLQRRLREHARTKAQDGALMRLFIEKRLVAFVEDEMVEPKIAMAAIDRIGKLTHVRAFDPPSARKEDEAPTTVSDTLNRLKNILKQGE
jgi:hypothetical protein